MQTYFGTLTIGAAPVQIPATAFSGNLSSFAGSAKVNKISVQLAPGNTGVSKVGGSANMTSDNTTPGIFLAPNTVAADPGGSWTVESYGNVNDVALNQYFFQGTVPGDKLMYEIHVVS
jgi:hypothetical protein